MKFKNILSLKPLIILWFAIAVIPLFLSIMYATQRLQESSASARTIHLQVLEQSKTLGLLLQKTSDIERKARLFVLLSDPALRQPYERDSYESARATFKQALSALLKLRVDNKITLLINELSEKENLIYQEIIDSESEKNFELPIDEAFVGLREASNTLAREFEIHAEQALNDSRLSSESLEKDLLFKGTILLAIAVMLTLFLLITLSRSIRQVDKAIRRLTSGDLYEQIKVDGPTDFQNIGKRLEWLRSYLAWLLSSRQRLLQNLAHAIERRLQTMSNHCECLMTGQDQSSKQLIFQQLTENIDQLKSISEQLVQYNQLQTDRLTKVRHFVEINVEQLLETVIDDYRADLQAKSITIDSMIKPTRVKGIPEQMHDILEQILANAIHCSPEHGAIRISLCNVRGQMELDISDDSPDAALENRNQLFEPFNPANIDKYPGLGLTLVREYVAQHQGKISFTAPNPDHQHLGSRLKLQIPMDIEA